MNKPLFSVILPTYNESVAIAGVLSAIHTQLRQYRYEILVVDDNSPDGTSRVVEKLSKSGIPVTCLINKTRVGLAESILRGIKAARGMYIIGMDADYNHDPVTIPLLIQSIKQAELVVASRFLRG